MEFVLDFIQNRKKDIKIIGKALRREGFLNAFSQTQKKAYKNQ